MPPPKSTRTAAIPAATRADATRARILAAARSLFARHGYERTTVRAIATDADIHASLVMRYFGSKENLFAAAGTFELRLPDLRGVKPRKRGRYLAAHFLQRWEKADAMGELPALLRLAVTHPDGRERMALEMRKQIFGALVAVMSEREALVRGALCGTQMAGLAYLRYVVQMPPVVALSDELIIAAVGDTLQRYLEWPVD